MFRKVLLISAVLILILLSVGISLTIGWRPSSAPGCGQRLRASSIAHHSGWHAESISPPESQTVRAAIPSGIGNPTALQL